MSTIEEGAMTSELEKAAVIWAKDLNANTVQFCDSRGSRSEEAFVQKCKLSFEMGAMFERKRIFAEAEKKKVEADCISTGYHCSPDEVVKMEDLKEICRIKTVGDRFNDNGNEFEVVSEPSLDGRVYARQICKVDSNAELEVKNEQ